MATLGKLTKIHLSGFKSIKELDLELGGLNVLIGANGVGKSNFINFFKFMNKIQSKDLQIYVAQNGRADSFLHFGSRETSEIKIHLTFYPNEYKAELVNTQDERLVFKKEVAVFDNSYYGNSGVSVEYLSVSGAEESGLAANRLTGISAKVSKYISEWKIYHFHDTSDEAKVKKTCSINDNRRLNAQGENLAAFLYSIKDTPSYKTIVQTIQRIAPFFHDFILNPDKNNPDQIRLTWKHKGSDAYFDAHSFSDGTLRFICLATLLLQPKLPTAILLDEPELGLHPYAMQLLGGMIKSASVNTQIILSTQSVTLANQFEWQDIIIVEQNEYHSEFKRLKEEDVKAWLDDYKIGDMWEKNIIGGTPK